MDGGGEEEDTLNGFRGGKGGEGGHGWIGGIGGTCLDANGLGDWRDTQETLIHMQDKLRIFLYLIMINLS